MQRQAPFLCILERQFRLEIAKFGAASFTLPSKYGPNLKPCGFTRALEVSA